MTDPRNRDRLRLAPTPALAVSLALLAAVVAHAQSDGIDLAVEPGDGGTVDLTWTGGSPEFAVHRAEAPDAVPDPASRVGITAGRSWSDGPPPGSVWFYAVYAPCETDPAVDCVGEAIDPAVVAQGAYPDVAVAADGTVHLVYMRAGALYHRTRAADTGAWSVEESTGVSGGRIERSDPEVVVDSQGRPHVFMGSGYAWRTDTGWQSMTPLADRDTAMAIDGQDNVYICRRGGNDGGWLGLRVRRAGSSSFEWLPDPDIANGLPLGRNDHVYGHVFVDPTDDSVHVVYRHGAPTNFAYRGSENAGFDWFGGGVSSDDTEAPSGVVHTDGTIWVVGGAGNLHRRSGTPSSWQGVGRALTANGRDLPALSTDASGNVYASSFGGRYNVYRTDGTWAGEALLPSLSGLPLGFAETFRGPGDFVYVVYEEGNAVDDDLLAGMSDIVFATIGPDGTVGSGAR